MRAGHVITLCVALSMMIGCRSRKSDASPPMANSSGDASHGLAAAQQFCTDHAGSVTTFKAKQGDPVCACVFGSARIELVTLYRAKQSKAVDLLMTGGTNQGSSPPQAGNPASIFCEDKGGTGIVALDDSGEFSFCHFPDSSMIEEWTLFKGLESADNEKLKAAVIAARS